MSEDITHWKYFAYGAITAIGCIFIAGYIFGTTLGETVYDHRLDLKGFIYDVCDELTPDPKHCVEMLCLDKEKRKTVGY